MSNAIIEIRDVSHSFPGTERDGPAVPAVANISLKVQESEFVAIVGPSGCGKSTLLNMIAGLIQPEQGEVIVRGKRVLGVDPSLNLGYMFARDGLMPWRTTLRNVAYGLELRRQKDAVARGRQLLELVGLRGFENHFRSQLSQGMRQRAALARTLATDPDILLLDEPFGALDAQTKVLLEEEFVRIRAERGNTVVFVTHDLMEAITLADRVIVGTARPMKIKADVFVPIPHPRSPTETRFDPIAEELFVTLWDELRSEAVGI